MSICTATDYRYEMCKQDSYTSLTNFASSLTLPHATNLAKVWNFRKVHSQNLIYTIRGEQVMLDSDLSKIYGVETRVLNQAVTRNIDRFPEKFRFQLTTEEWENLKFQIGISTEGCLKSQSVTLKKGRRKHRKYLSYAFTEPGVAMLAAVLRVKQV